MATYQLDDFAPHIHSTAWIAESAVIIGDAHIGPDASVWSQAVIRADNAPITIGSGSNVQEAAVLHTDPGLPLTIGKNVTIGHQAMLHGCTIGDGSLIGIQAVVLNGASVGKNSLVGAGALITEGKTFEDGVLIIGSPARVARKLRDEEILKLQQSSEVYVKRAAHYRTALKRIG
jgi:carbonic anhydrase/acetyltransferase-like protein (isoleucine patch superfamily)